MADDGARAGLYIHIDGEWQDGAPIRLRTLRAKDLGELIQGIAELGGEAADEVRIEGIEDGSVGVRASIPGHREDALRRVFQSAGDPRAAGPPESRRFRKATAQIMQRGGKVSAQLTPLAGAVERYELVLPQAPVRPKMQGTTIIHGALQFLGLTADAMRDPADAPGASGEGPPAKGRLQVLTAAWGSIEVRATADQVMHIGGMARLRDIISLQGEGTWDAAGTRLVKLDIRATPRPLLSSVQEAGAGLQRAIDAARAAVDRSGVPITADQWLADLRGASSDE